MDLLEEKPLSRPALRDGTLFFLWAANNLAGVWGLGRGSAAQKQEPRDSLCKLKESVGKKSGLTRI